MGGSVSFPLPFIIRVGGWEKYPPQEGKKGGRKVKGGGGREYPPGVSVGGCGGGPEGGWPSKKTGMQGPAFNVIGDNVWN